MKTGLAGISGRYPTSVASGRSPCRSRTTGGISLRQSAARGCVASPLCILSDVLTSCIARGHPVVPPDADLGLTSPLAGWAGTSRGPQALLGALRAPPRGIKQAAPADIVPILLTLCRAGVTARRQNLVPRNEDHGERCRSQADLPTGWGDHPKPSLIQARAAPPTADFSPEPFSQRPLRSLWGASVACPCP